MDYRSVAALDARQGETAGRLASRPAGLKRMVAALMLIAGTVVLLDHGSGRADLTQRADASTNERIVR